jgi:hypothetical protein
MPSTRQPLRAPFLLVLTVVVSMALVSKPAYANAGSSTTTLATSSGSLAAGSVLTLTASVQSGGGSPLTVGRVNFCDADASFCVDAHLLGTAQLTTAGTAVLRFVPGIGTHHYKAVFAGNGSSLSSTSSVSAVTVTGTYTTTTALTTSGSAGIYTLNAAIAGTGSTTAPTGNVAFADTTHGSASLGSAPLVGGAGSLSWTSSSLTGPGSGSIAPVFVFGDFNGDGKLDVAQANGTGVLTILLGNGDGTFSAGPVSTVANLSTLAVGDFNGDGKLDLAGTGPFNTVLILLGNGDGTFTTGTSTTVGVAPAYLAVADFNGDGKADLAVGTSYSALSILLGNGDGTFTNGIGALNAPNRIGMVAVGDFNGDGKADLAVTNSENYAVVVLMGNGDGSFAMGPTFTQGTAFTAVGDFNGDGRSDLIVTSAPSGPGQITVELGNADGTFTPVVSSVANYRPLCFAVADFNLDGKLDLAASTSNGPNTMTVLLGNGDGTFTTAAGINTSLSSEYLAAADLNGDGLPDLGVQNPPTTSILLTHLSASAMATLSNVALSGAGAHSLQASYAGDTSYAASSSSTTTVTVQPVTTTLVLGANPGTSAFGQQVALTATLAPYAAQSLTTNGENITFSSGGVSIGTAVLNLGVATLNVTSLPVGTATLTAAYAGDANFAASASNSLSYTVTAAAPTISFSVAARTYGSAPFAVSATSNSTGAISYAVLSGPATVTGSTVTLTGAGPVVLVASQAASGNYAAGSQQASFTVSKASAGVALASSVNPVLLQNSVSLSVTVSSTVGSPTGTVTFLDGSTVLGSSAVSGGAATLSVATLALGAHTMTATYSGDANFLGGTSNTVTETVLDLGLTLASGSTASQTVSAGGMATYTLAISPTGGTTFPSALTFTASGLPTGATATFSPSAIPAGSGATNVTLTIQTVKTTAMLAPVEGLAVAALAMLVLPFRMKRRLVRLACVGALLVVASVAVTGCGSGSVTSQPQSYNVVVTVASGSLNHTTTVTLVVQ